MSSISTDDATSSDAKCDICGGPLELALVVRDYPVLHCSSCRHRQLRPIDDLESHLDQVYADSYFEGSEDGYSDYLSSRPLLEKRGQEIRGLLERFGLERRGSVLDVGCAAGFLLSSLRAAGYETVGVEPNSRIAGVARSNLDCEVVIDGCEGFLAREESGPRRHFDAILLVQVIAHLDSPAEAVQRLSRRLSAGGLLLVETWNYQSVAARLFGARWHEYRPPSVRHWFSPHSLDEVADRARLCKLAGGVAWKSIQWQHARGLIAHTLSHDWNQPTMGRVFSALARAAPGRLALPYPGDDAFWAIYRKL